MAYCYDISLPEIKVCGRLMASCCPNPTPHACVTLCDHLPLIPENQLAAVVFADVYEQIPPQGKSSIKVRHFPKIFIADLGDLYHRLNLSVAPDTSGATSPFITVEPNTVVVNSPFSVVLRNHSRAYVWISPGNPICRLMNTCLKLCDNLPNIPEDLPGIVQHSLSYARVEPYGTTDVPIATLTKLGKLCNLPERPLGLSVEDNTNSSVTLRNSSSNIILIRPGDPICQFVVSDSLKTTIEKVEVCSRPPPPYPQSFTSLTRPSSIKVGIAWDSNYRHLASHRLKNEAHGYTSQPHGDDA